MQLYLRTNWQQQTLYFNLTPNFIFQMELLHISKCEDTDLPVISGAELSLKQQVLEQPYTIGHLSLPSDTTHMSLPAACVPGLLFAQNRTFCLHIQPMGLFFTGGQSPPKTSEQISKYALAG